MRAIVTGLCIGTVAVLSVAAARSQMQLTTAERVAEARWWPTKTAAVRADYVGAAVCARCHEAKAKSQSATAMARTASRAVDSEVLRSRRVLTFKGGPYSHEVRTTAETSAYAVSDGTRTVSEVLEWALGAGKVGQTFLFARGGAMHESRASYFGTIDGLGHTPGRVLDPRQNLEAASGRRLSASETRRCLGCHTSALWIRDGSVLDLIPGVGCEGCHGPGRAHADAMQAEREKEGLAAIVNPAAFNAVDSVDFCGACHATYWDVTLAGEKGIAALRSQPYRLQSSRCWGDGDRRITCVACHNPHEPLQRDARSYDRRCLSCHRGADAAAASHRPLPAGPTGVLPHAPACGAGRAGDCAACHMPKYRVPEMHFSFTDHLIRVVRPD